MDEPSRQADECVLDDVLGESAVSGQEIREPDGTVRVTQVELAQPAGVGSSESVHT